METCTRSHLRARSRRRFACCAASSSSVCPSLSLATVSMRCSRSTESGWCVCKPVSVPSPSLYANLSRRSASPRSAQKDKDKRQKAREDMLAAEIIAQAEDGEQVKTLALTTPRLSPTKTSTKASNYSQCSSLRLLTHSSCAPPSPWVTV